MRRKYISRLFLVGLTVLSVSSCESFGDDMLTQKNPNVMTTDTFWNNLNDCNKGLTAVYKSFSNENVYLQRDDSHRADITFAWQWDTAYETSNEYYNQNFTDASVSVGAKWAVLYEGIFRANQVIAGLNGIKGNMESESDIREWELTMGQARFFRGLFHHYLNKTYNNGDVPVMDFVPKNESEFLMPCSESSAVKEFYRSDLIYAESVLPVKGAADDWSRETGTMGRVTSGAASTVLGVSHLYDKEYDVAKGYFAKVINNSSYSLVPNIKDNFSSLNEFNAESILEISYSLDHNTEYTVWDSKNLSNYLNVNLAPNPVGGWGNTIPSYWLYRDFTHEPVDRRNPANKVMLNHDIHGDIFYFNTKSVTESKEGSKIYHSYPVLPNPKARPEGIMEATYYIKTVEVDENGEPVVANISSLTADELTSMYKLISSGDMIYPARAYSNIQSLTTVPFTKDDGAIVNQQTGETWKVFYDSADRPYRYKIHSDRASSSIITYTEGDMQYYQNIQTFAVWTFSNAVSAYRKYTNWDIVSSEEDVSPNKRSAINFRMLRLADVYLMYAECLIEGGTNDGGVSEAMKYINRVRKRAGTVLIGSESDASAEYNGVCTYQDSADVEESTKSYTNLYNRTGEDYVIATAAQVMDHLMYKERPLELCLEGHAIRFNDLRRWGITKARFQELASQPYATNGFTGYNLETKKDVNLWSWGVDYSEDMEIGYGPKYQYRDAALNYNDSKAYFPIPNDEALSNPEIGTVVKVQ